MKVHMGTKTYEGLMSLLFLTKIAYILIALFVFRPMVGLGDVDGYLSSSLFFDVSVFYSSTSFMRFWGAIFGFLPDVLAQLPLMLLSFYGLMYFLKTCKKHQLIESSAHKTVFFVFVATPSFAMWSSVHSKEAVGVFFSSIIISEIINIYFNHKVNSKKLLLLSIYLCFLFKAQYMVAIINAIMIMKLSKAFKNQYVSFCIFIVAVLVQLLILAKMSYFIDELSFSMYSHFDTATADSTRENIFFESGDFFRHAPYGMFISFFGVTISEVIDSPFKVIFFIEGLLLIAIILYLFLSVFRGILDLKFNYIAFFLIVLVFFWLLFVHYPFGVFNAGSALRYRTNFMMLLIGLLFMVNKRRYNIY